MSITQRGNPAFDPELTNVAIAKKARLEKLKAENDADLGIRLQKVINRAPNLPPSVIVPLAKAGATDKTIDTIAATSALKTSEEIQPQTNDTFLSKWLVKPIKWVSKELVIDPIKGISRNLTSSSEFGGDVAANLASGAAMKIGGIDQQGATFLGSTRAAQFFGDYQNQGEGYFQPDAQREAAAIEAGKYRGTYDFSETGTPEPYTVGKTIAEPLTPDFIFDPMGSALSSINRLKNTDLLTGQTTKDDFERAILEMQAAKNLPETANKTGQMTVSTKNATNSWDLAAESAISGLIDGAISIVTDPTLGLGKIIKVGRTISKGIKTLSGTQDVVAVSKISKLKQLGQASLDFVGTADEPMQGVIYTPKGLRAAYVAGQLADVIPDAESTFAAIDRTRQAFNTERNILEKNLYEDLIDAGTSPQDAINEVKRRVDDLATLRSADETKIWDEAAVTSFIKRDSRVRTFFDTVVDVEQGSALSYRIRHYIFKDRISVEQSAEIAEIVSKPIAREQKIAEIEQLFLGFTQRLKQGPNAGLFPTDVEALTGRGIFEKFVQKDLPVGGLERGIPHGHLRKYLGNNPNGVGIVVDGSAAQRAASIHNFRLLLSMDPSLTQRQIYEYLDPFEKALTKRNIGLPTGEINPLTGLQDEIRMLGGAIGAGGTPSAIYTIYDQIETFMSRLLINYGFSPQQVEASLVNLRKDYLARTQNAVDAVGKPTDFGLFSHLLNDAAWISPEGRKEILDEASTILGRPVTPDDLRQLGPSVNIELLNSTIMLPDIEAIRQLTSWKPYSKAMWKRLDAATLMNAKGNLRGVFNSADFIVNDFWKPMILMNPAYLLRNVIEGQARLMFLKRNGVAGIFSNPARYFKALTERISPEDLDGKVFTLDQIDELANKAVSELTQSDQIFLDATTNSRWSQIPAQVGPNTTMQDMVQSGEWLTAKADVARDNFNYVNGVLDQMRLINLDPLQRLWAHLSDLPDSVSKVDEAMVWLNSGTELANKTKLTLLSAFENDIKYGFQNDLLEKASQSMVLPGRVLTQAQKNAALRSVLTKAIDGRVSRFDEIPELRALMSQNVVPILDPVSNRALVQNIRVTSEILDPDSGKVINFGLRGNQSIPVKDRLTGSVLRGPDGADFDYFVLGYKKGPRSGEDTLDVIQVKKSDRVAWSQAGDELNYDDDAIDLIRRMLANDKKEKTGIFPNSIGYAVRKPQDPNTVRDQWKTFVQGVFNSRRMGDGIPWLNRMGTASVNLGRIPSINSGVSFLEKLPTYRQLLWTTIMDNLNLLAPNEIENLLTYVQRRAEMFDMTPNAYLGGSKIELGLTSPGDRFAELQKRVDEVFNAENPATGTMQELNTYAHAKAKFDMENLFFDSGQKRGFDTGVNARLNFQFAVAQRTIIRDAMRLFANAPLEVYKMEKAFVGASQVDLNPYDQRPGFFYKNPQNGQFYFKVPGTDAALSLASAFNLLPQIPSTIRTYIGAPVKGINMGFNFFPSVGPIGQIFSSMFLKILPLNTEDKQTLKTVLLPYGERKVADIAGSFVPGYAKKLYSGIIDDRNNTDSLVGQNYVDVSMALMASGKYDPSSDLGMKKMQDDAIAIARVLTILQAANQFIGPATGTAQFEIQTKDGNFVAVELFAKELRKLQEREQENGYETAIPEIIALYGQAVGPYVSGKTRSAEGYSGLESTKEFYFFQQDNKKFFVDYPSVAGYFAPAGSDWFWGAWIGQLNAGEKERLTVPQIYDQYTYALGASKYRAARELYPTYLSDDQEEALRNYRIALNKEYPGYPITPKFESASFDILIQKLEKAITNPAVKNLDVTKAISDYLRVRANLKASVELNNLPGLRAKDSKERRASLAAYGRLLALKYPEFARIWDRELSSEVVMVGE